MRLIACHTMFSVLRHFFKKILTWHFREPIAVQNECK